MEKYGKITALYSRLSVGDEDRDGGESNSIQNQKIFLENYARQLKLTNIRHYIDDDESGRFFDRSGYARMMEDIENGKIGVCIMKDLTRWGRDYLQVGNAMEVFRRNNVRFIAVNNGIDSAEPDTLEFAPFINIMSEWYAKDIGFERKMTPWTSGLNILYGIGITAILALSVALQQRGTLPLPYLIGVLLFVFDLFGPLKALYGEASRLTVMNAALDRIEAVLKEVELPDTGKQHIPVTQPGHPEIAFEQVSFAYQNEDVLHGIDFTMEKNTMTALVGPSGGGKTTIANLLARLWDVKSGKVTIRGKDIRDVPLAELMEQISMVFQRVYLFQDTIYNNISMGKPNATEEEVFEAARKARCYDFIMALPDDFQTVIGEGGATLSGGEKQRISIARCILKDAPIIILDEATASVDTDNESYIQEAISELVKGKTLLVIAHRLNTIQAADQILVISDGRISQHGTHEELIAQPGIYQDFVNIRRQSSGWSLA